MLNIKNKWLVVFFLFIIFLLILRPRNYYENFENKNNNKKLLPIMDPMYNMREFCKQSILLEDHLTHPRKRCSDCINKHSLSLEALAEEACTLDKSGIYKNILIPLPEKCRELQKRLYNGENENAIVQEYRSIRKKLMPLCRHSF